MNDVGLIESLAEFLVAGRHGDGVPIVGEDQLWSCVGIARCQAIGQHQLAQAVTAKAGGLDAAQPRLAVGIIGSAAGIIGLRRFVDLKGSGNREKCAHYTAFLWRRTSSGVRARMQRSSQTLLFAIYQTSR